MIKFCRIRHKYNLRLTAKSVGVVVIIHEDKG
jgi:hypothetical protein